MAIIDPLTRCDPDGGLPRIFFAASRAQEAEALESTADLTGTVNVMPASRPWSLLPGFQGGGDDATPVTTGAGPAPGRAGASRKERAAVARLLALEDPFGEVGVRQPAGGANDKNRRKNAIIVAANKEFTSRDPRLFIAGAAKNTLGHRKGGPGSPVGMSRRALSVVDKLREVRGQGPMDELGRMDQQKELLSTAKYILRQAMGSVLFVAGHRRQLLEEGETFQKDSGLSAEQVLAQQLVPPDVTLDTEDFWTKAPRKLFYDPEMRADLGEPGDWRNDIEAVFPWLPGGEQSQSDFGIDMKHMGEVIKVLATEVKRIELNIAQKEYTEQDLVPLPSDYARLSRELLAMETLPKFRETAKNYPDSPQAIDNKNALRSYADWINAQFDRAGATVPGEAPGVRIPMKVDVDRIFDEQLADLKGADLHRAFDSVRAILNQFAKYAIQLKPEEHRLDLDRKLQGTWDAQAMELRKEQQFFQDNAAAIAADIKSEKARLLAEGTPVNLDTTQDKFVYSDGTQKGDVVSDDMPIAKLYEDWKKAQDKVAALAGDLIAGKERLARAQSSIMDSSETMRNGLAVAAAHIDATPGIAKNIADTLASIQMVFAKTARRLELLESGSTKAQAEAQLQKEIEDGSFNKAKGYIPNLAADPVYTAMKTERSMGGAAALGYSPKLGFHVYDSATQGDGQGNSSFAKIQKDHPHLKRDVARSKKNQQEISARGFIPNFINREHFSPASPKVANLGTLLAKLGIPQGNFSPEVCCPLLGQLLDPSMGFFPQFAPPQNKASSRNTSRTFIPNFAYPLSNNIIDSMFERLGTAADERGVRKASLA